MNDQVGCRFCGNELTQGSEDQNWTTGHLIGQADGSTSANGGHNRVDDVQEQLSRAGSVSENVEDGRVEVTETVSRPLTKHGDHNDLGETPAAAVRRDERTVWRF